MILEDGTGNGFATEVDRFKRARVFSTSTTQEHHAAGLGVGYMFSTQSVISVPDTFVGHFLIVQNTNASLLLGIQKMTLSASAAGVIANVYRQPVIGTLSANTAVTGVNTNFGSASTAQASANRWDGTGTTGVGGVTGGAQLETIVLGIGKTQLDYDGALDLLPNSVISVHLSNSTGGAISVSANIRSFFESVPPPAPS